MDWIFNLKEIEAVAVNFLHQYSQKTVFAVHGEMGSGKTTFIACVCRMMGVSAPVSSPTFSIINEYEAKNKRIYHLDLYRLKSQEEAVQAGVEDVLFSGDSCFVEWPEKAPELFPPDTIHMFLTQVDADTRKLTV
jgi:tRNA threonylcarbamoyladenosine biosynthesis protein TsaE